MNNELMNMELFDFEQFKKETGFDEEGNILLDFKTAEEQWAFKKYLSQNNIFASGFGLLESDFRKAGVAWCSPASSVWGMFYEEAERRGKKIVYLDHFCSKPFTSTEDELLRFLK